LLAICLPLVGRHAADRFFVRRFFLSVELAYSGLGRLSHSCLSGPAGFPRENLSLIGIGLIGHPALGALDFHP
jgi:hypothetical protein